MASVIQMTTAKVRIASMRCPATGKPAGVGNNKMTMSAATAANRPQFEANQFDSLTLGCAAARSVDCVRVDIDSSMRKIRPSQHAQNAELSVEAHQNRREIAIDQCLSGYRSISAYV